MSFQIKKGFFQIGALIHLILRKKLSFQRKSQLLKKIRHFENIKKNSSWIQPLGVIFMFFLNSLQKIHKQSPQINLDLFVLYFQSKFRSADAKAIVIWKIASNVNVDIH